MCGFSGILRNSKASAAFPVTSFQDFERAAQQIQKRGRDGYGYFRSPGEDSPLWVAHHRLAFQDVELGGQPMLLPSHSLGIVFNGEIYNHLDIRAKLEKLHRPGGASIPWQTRSDTETLLWGYALLGAQIVDELDGEFAFCVFHIQGKFLFAARDPFGVKPFFFRSSVSLSKQLEIWEPHKSFELDDFQFASEIKAFATPHSWCRDGFIRQAVGLYHPCLTPYLNTYSLPPGGRLLIEEQTGGKAPYQAKLAFTSGPIRCPHSKDSPLSHSISSFGEAFQTSVQRRLLSDVPLGVYLSGGIDSMAVALALAQHRQNAPELSHPLVAFTVGFSHQEFDETPKASQFAKLFGFEHHAVRVNLENLAYAYPHAVYASENVQPFTNGAAKWWLSKLARRHVRGVLTGDGSDELLCGYPSFAYTSHYQFARRVGLHSSWRDQVFLKRFARSAQNPWLAGLSTPGDLEDFNISLGLWGVAHPLTHQIVTLAQSFLGGEAHAWLEQQGPILRSLFTAGFTGASPSLLENSQNATLLWQNYFCKTHLPVQVLNWVGDRMEMANNLEGRTPFMGRSVQEWLKKARHTDLMAGFTNKVSLRRYLKKSLPAQNQLSQTPKMQFGAPFLDVMHMLDTYQYKDVLEKLGLDKLVDWPNLKKKVTLPLSTYETAEVFSKANAHIFMQTLLSASILNQSLIHDQPLGVDESHENQVMEGAFSPNSTP
jgi:asparagine synthase (glutamine-hydrolysing)